MELWCWLLSNKDSVRLIAYLIFGLSSFLLACVALWVAYRNNFGWGPLTEDQNGSIGGASAPPIEVWAHVFDPKSDRHYVVRAKSITGLFIARLIFALARTKC